MHDLLSRIQCVTYMYILQKVVKCIILLIKHTLNFILFSNPSFYLISQPSLNIHSFIPDISQVHYYSEALQTAASLIKEVFTNEKLHR